MNSRQFCLCKCKLEINFPFIKPFKSSCSVQFARGVLPCLVREAKGQEHSKLKIA